MNRKQQAALTKLSRLLLRVQRREEREIASSTKHKTNWPLLRKLERELKREKK